MNEERDLEEGLGSLPETLRRERGTLNPPPGGQPPAGGALPPGQTLPAEEYPPSVPRSRAGRYVPPRMGPMAAPPVPPDILAMGGRVPPDIQRQEGVERIPELPDRLMSQGASVRCVYDSRPINAQDFIYTEEIIDNIPFSDPGTRILNFTFNVPGGYVAVLRGFHYEAAFQLGLPVDRQTYKCSILVNNIIKLEHADLLLGQVTQKYQPTFLLAPLGGSITLRLSIIGQDIVDAGGEGDFPVYAELYGNLLLSQGVPLPFEIGNTGPIHPLGG